MRGLCAKTRFRVGPVLGFVSLDVVFGPFFRQAKQRRFIPHPGFDAPRKSKLWGSLSSVAAHTGTDFSDLLGQTERLKGLSRDCAGTVTTQHTLPGQLGEL